MVAGLVITDKKSQSEAISKLASAANDCDEECSASAANALDGASVDGDDSIIQVSMVANALPLEIMTDDGLVSKRSHFINFTRFFAFSFFLKFLKFSISFLASTWRNRFKSFP